MLKKCSKRPLVVPTGRKNVSGQKRMRQREIRKERGEEKRNEPLMGRTKEKTLEQADVYVHKG